MLDKIKGYRTVIFNIVMSFAVITTLLTGVNVENEVTQLQKGFDLLIESLTVLWAAGNIWLRAITDSPIFKGKK